MWTTTGRPQAGWGGALERLDEKKIDLLRRWGDGLADDPREELRAAGRAIQLLIEEIEQLHVISGARARPAPSPSRSRLSKSRTFRRASARVSGSSEGGAAKSTGLLRPRG